MLLFSLAIIGGLIILIWSADRFVEGAVASALKIGMTPMMIGITIVAFGTSAPELIVSATAAFEGASNLAVGNALGSNIANIALVLGITALVSAIPVTRGILKIEMPILITATLLATLFIMDATLTFWDGIALLILLTASLLALAKLASGGNNGTADEIAETALMSSAKAYGLLGFSIILLLGSSHLLVWGAEGIAKALGVSDLIIGLTIVAIGTSLPELAASIASAMKNQHELALGNIIGSNLFNLLAVLAIPALVHPPEIDASALYRDYGVMLGLTIGLALLAFCNHLFEKPYIGKFAGILLFSSYVVYLAVLFQQTTSTAL